MYIKEANLEFGSDHEFNENPNNWRRGEGLSLKLRKATGDPKAFPEPESKKMSNKYLEKIAEKAEKEGNFITRNPGKVGALIGAAGMGIHTRRGVTKIFKDPEYRRAARTASKGDNFSKKELKSAERGMKNAITGTAVGLGAIGGGAVGYGAGKVGKALQKKRNKDI